MKFIYTMVASLAIAALAAYQVRAADVNVQPGAGVNVNAAGVGVHVNGTQPNGPLNAANVDVRADGPAQAREIARENAISVNSPDRWRYKYEGNRWWYYGPDNRWMWYSEPSGWTYYQSGTPYTANYGTVPVVPEPAYVAPAPAVQYYPGYSYGYPGYYYGPGVYIGGPRWGVRVGGRRWW